MRGIIISTGPRQASGFRDEFSPEIHPLDHAFTSIQGLLLAANLHLIPHNPCVPSKCSHLGRESQLPSAVNVPGHLGEWLTPFPSSCLKSIETNKLVYPILRKMS